MPARFVTAWIAATVALAGEELPKGKVVDKVICSGNERQSYALYIPTTYEPANRRRPILYCLDPGARGRVPVDRFAAAAEKAGFLVAGSNNSRNGPIEPVREAIAAMLSDTQARFPIDDKRIYIAGFSGGARVALQWGSNGAIAGVIACSAGWQPGEIPAKVPFKLFATAGVDDFNYHEVYAMSRELESRGVAHRFMELRAGHDWLTSEAAAIALDFFDGKAPPQAAPDSKEEQKQAALFEDTWSRYVNANDEERATLIDRLRSDSQARADGRRRRIARQVLGQAFVVSMQTASTSMEKKDYAAAARSFELCVQAAPDRAGAWYALAVARAGNQDRRGALNALERAVKLGFHDGARIQSEPLFEALRGEAKYKALMKSLETAPPER